MATPARRDFTLEQWLHWFETLHPKKIDLTLDRVITILDRLNLRPPPYKVITVAGTNGKGSCVAMLESIYWHAGYEVGTFTSPHLWRFNERIRFDGSDASDAELIELFNEIDSVLGSVTLSYFESSAVAAFLHFARRGAEVVILEVGMGGRLDATNTVDADCAVIVSIDLDHQEWLGETRGEIGCEKAGIVRPGRPVVIGDPDPPQAMLDFVTRLRALPRRIGHDFGFRRDGRQWRRLHDTDQDAALPLPPFGGDEQFANAAACSEVVALLQADLPVTQQALATGIERAYLRGRLERHDIDGVEWVFDVGHNPAAVARLVASLQRTPVAGRSYVVFAAMRDKDLSGVLRPLVALAEGWFVTQASGERGATGEALADLLAALGAERVQTVSGVVEACASARLLAQVGDRVVVFGSFHTVGAATEALRLYCAPSPLRSRPAQWIRD